MTADGKPGWKEAGADTVIPFKGQFCFSFPQIRSANTNTGISGTIRMIGKGYKTLFIESIKRNIAYNVTITIYGISHDSLKTILWTVNWPGWTTGTTSSPVISISAYDYIELYYFMHGNDERYLLISNITFS